MDSAAYFSEKPSCYFFGFLLMYTAEKVQLADPLFMQVAATAPENNVRQRTKKKIECGKIALGAALAVVCTFSGAYVSSLSTRIILADSIGSQSGSNGTYSDGQALQLIDRASPIEDYAIAASLFLSYFLVKLIECVAVYVFRNEPGFVGGVLPVRVAVAGRQGEAAHVTEESVGDAESEDDGEEEIDEDDMVQGLAQIRRWNCLSVKSQGP